MAELVFDPANFGESAGLVRQEVDPRAQLEAFRDAITCASGCREVDPGRVGIWGSSPAGGHGLVESAIDERVKAAASQVPAVRGSATLARRARLERCRALRAALEEDRRDRGQGLPARAIQVLSRGRVAARGDSRSDAMWHDDASMPERRAPTWHSEVTLRPLEAVSEDEPGQYARLFDRAPLLLITADLDDVAPADLAAAAFEEVRSTKERVALAGTSHFDVCHGARFARASSSAREWFEEHL